jgi:hypothetical protein
LLDFDMLQTPHGERGAVPPTVNTVRESYADKPMMPVINGEAAYEMLGDSLPTEWTRRMFWVCMMNGAAGHTYGANGIWQANRKGQPHGPSPPAGSPPTGYGIIPWDEAMKLPGSTQIGLGKKLLEQYAWQKFQPHPEWAEFADKSALSVRGSQWIWFPEGNPSQNAPAEKRFFRRTFVLPRNQPVDRARVSVSVDDRFTAWLNGHTLGSGNGWQSARQFNIPTVQLRPGTNVLAVEARNMPASGSNPAGLIAAMEVHFSKGETLKLTSDGDWSVAKAAPSGWKSTEFDDTAWSKAMVVARYGDSPWGKIEQPGNDDAYGPQSAGISNTVRVIYVPENQTISVRELGPSSSHVAKIFDAVSGKITSLGRIRADGTGRWQCSPPATCDHDWVLILETTR